LLHCLKSTNFKDPHYVDFSNTLSLFPFLGPNILLKTFRICYSLLASRLILFNYEHLLELGLLASSEPSQ
jgi:hypothetical protein